MKFLDPLGFLFLPALTLLMACSGPSNDQNGIERSQDTIPLLTKADSNVIQTRLALEKDSSEENFIWYGRRLGYVNKMKEAIDVFTSGINKYPHSWKLYRFRGHRFISTREFTLAIRDLNQAKRLMQESAPEIEPDGLPNKLNKPLSTYQFNVFYHLGLAYYLNGQFDMSENAFQECLKLSDNDDLYVASADWLYMIYRRRNNQKSANSILSTIPSQMNIIENDAYFKRLKMYQGLIQPDSLLSVSGDENEAALTLATQGYGVGNWFYYNGQSDKAWIIFKKVTEGTSTYSFGFIASETDLARLWRKQ